jgi:hypothetical protein
MWIKFAALTSAPFGKRELFSIFWLLHLGLLSAGGYSPPRKHKTNFK